MLKFGVKSAVLGSAVYYTIDKGIWKDSATTSAFYDELESGLKFLIVGGAFLQFEFINMLKFGVKLAVLGSAVYYTIDKGIWKDSATTSAFYEELESGVSPYVGELKKQIPYELPPLPSNDRLSYLMKYYWNCGVKTTFNFLVDLPTHTSNAAVKIYDTVSSSLDAADQKTNSSQEK
ncbi:Protein QIL1 [Operophtera brumata]|uniref:MICOS complex subunit MIC13 n=1 Tax=Operophtera brumata TaxID=104452 RepID=A0A0L7LMX3_OPEBR|nr:Protein QIL1 [Operophtera brumata]